jgi:hypothetical protein
MYYLLAIPSTLTLPGPQKSIVRKPTKKIVAFSPVLKKSMLCTLNNATDMFITRGTATALVNKPMIRKSAQKNSAKMESTSELVDPMPHKL